MKSRLMAACVIAAVGMMLAVSAPAYASIIQYTITVDVTTAGIIPGSFPSNPWSFSSVPSTSVGTFDADDTASGAISNLQLTIGGLDMAVSHPSLFYNSFDPNTLVLDWWAFDPSLAESSVVFGPSWGGPSNYVVATEMSMIPPFDTYVPFTQNWAGTYSVAPTPLQAQVPEPTAFLIWSLLGVLGLTFGRYRRRKTA